MIPSVFSRLSVSHLGLLIEYNSMQYPSYCCVYVSVSRSLSYCCVYVSVSRSLAVLCFLQVVPQNSTFCVWCLTKKPKLTDHHKTELYLQNLYLFTWPGQCNNTTTGQLIKLLIQKEESLKQFWQTTLTGLMKSIPCKIFPHCSFLFSFPQTLRFLHQTRIHFLNLCFLPLQHNEKDWSCLVSDWQYWNMSGLQALMCFGVFNLVFPKLFW